MYNIVRVHYVCPCRRCRIQVHDEFLKYLACCSVLPMLNLNTTCQQCKLSKVLKRRYYVATKTTIHKRDIMNKSSAVAEMGDRGHNRHGPKGGGMLCPFRGALGTRLIQRGLRGGL